MTQFKFISLHLGMLTRHATFSDAWNGLTHVTRKLLHTCKTSHGSSVIDKMLHYEQITDQDRKDGTGCSCRNGANI